MVMYAVHTHAKCVVFNLLFMYSINFGVHVLYVCWTHVVTVCLCWWYFSVYYSQCVQLSLQLVV